MKGCSEEWQELGKKEYEPQDKEMMKLPLGLRREQEVKGQWKVNEDLNSLAPRLNMVQFHPCPFQLTFLSQRYVPPDQVKGSTYPKGSASTPVQGSIAEGKPLRTLLGDPVPSLSSAASTSSQVMFGLGPPYLPQDYFGNWQAGFSPASPQLHRW